MNGTIFDIKRYAIHDGPGIRTTVFFKGCPLRCQWCHNPEGIQRRHEIMVRSSQCAAACRDCISRCPRKAIQKAGTVISIDRKSCDLCGICAEVCVYAAVEIIGREVTVDEIIDEVEKDRIFFEESGGGVTLSGGEPLAQGDFALALLDTLEGINIHTAIDTSGCVPYEVLAKAGRKADLVLYDLKVMDERKHQDFTGESNRLILENLKRLSNEGCDILLRMPVLEGLNDSPENILSMADFLVSLNRSWAINLLPYHKGGEGKSMRLNRTETPGRFRIPSEKKLLEIKEQLSSYGFRVKIGG